MDKFSSCNDEIMPRQTFQIDSLVLLITLRAAHIKEYEV